MPALVPIAAATPPAAPQSSAASATAPAQVSTQVTTQVPSRAAIPARADNPTTTPHADVKVAQAEPPQPKPAPSAPVPVRAVETTPAQVQPVQMQPAQIEPAPIETHTAAASVQSLPAYSAPPAHSHGGWLIQIGAFDDEVEAKQHLSAAQIKVHAPLAAKDPFTERVQKGDKALYRARFAGFDKSTAEAACRALKRSDFECMALKD